MGEEARSLLEPGSQLLSVIKAGSHYEVMTIYYERMGWGSYSTQFSEDQEPYPEEWRTIQNSSAPSDG